MTAKQLVLKVQMREDIRRIPFSIAESMTAASTFQSIRAVVAKEYSVTDLSTMGLLYKNKEGDVCPLVENTVALAVGLYGAGGVLPLVVTKQDPGKHGPASKSLTYSGAADADAEDSDNEALPQQEGGWADGATDDEYGAKVLQRISAAPAAAAPKRRPGRRDGPDGPSPMTPFQVWVEETTFQVGNLAHEVRNALRFWSSLVTPEPGKEPSEKMLLFKKADAQSGQLEGLMRKLAGRVRNAPVLMKPMRRLLPKAQQLIGQIWTNLSALDSTLPATHQQRMEVEKLVTQEGSYLESLNEALESEQARLNPPQLAYSKVIFSKWTQEEADGMATATATITRGECLSAEQLLCLARLACNSSHELQNLAVPPRGGAGAPFMQSLRQIDNIAGKCENASRCIMVLAHRWKITNRPQPVKVIAARVTFLIQAEDKVRRLLQAAMEAEGGGLVPAQAYQETLGRLHKLSGSLAEAKMAVGLK